MNQGITNKGEEWEKSKTKWLMILAFVACGWASLLYMGVKVKEKKWRNEGLIYCALVFIGLNFTGSATGDNVGGFLALVGWLMGLFRFFSIKNDYLLRLEAMENAGQVSGAMFRQQIPPAQPAQQTQTVQQVQPAPFVNAAPVNPAPQPAEAQFATGQPIDVNTCDESTLAALPGVSVAMAKKALAHREETGGFASVDEFFAFLELKPHIISQLSGNLVCSNTGNKRQGGRILDF